MPRILSKSKLTSKTNHSYMYAFHIRYKCKLVLSLIFFNIKRMKCKFPIFITVQNNYYRSLKCEDSRLLQLFMFRMHNHQWLSLLYSYNWYLQSSVKLSLLFFFDSTRTRIR